MLDASNFESRYPLETEEALVRLEELASKDPNLELVLRRAKAFAELKQRGDRKKIGYAISYCFADTVCWNFAEYIKTGHLFFQVHGAEKELGQDISLAEAEKEWGFPFVVRFYRDERKSWEELILKWRKKRLEDADRWKMPSLKKLAPYLSDNPYEAPSVPQDLWDEIRDEARFLDTFDNIYNSLTRVVPDDPRSYQHAGIIVGKDENGYIMLDKSGQASVRTTDFEACDYTKQSDFVLCEGFDLFNSREQEIVEAGFHESKSFGQGQRVDRHYFDSFGRKIDKEEI